MRLLNVVTGFFPLLELDPYNWTSIVGVMTAPGILPPFSFLI